jgi:hypothetical protein
VRSWDRPSAGRRGRRLQESHQGFSGLTQRSSPELGEHLGEGLALAVDRRPGPPEVSELKATIEFAEAAAL